MLVKLLSVTDRARFEPVVISLVDGGELAADLGSMGIECLSLGMRRSVPNPLALLGLARQIRRLRPDVVQSWMYHADLLALLAAAISGRPPVVWNIRHSNLDQKDSKLGTRMVARLCAMLSYLGPRRILCVSQRARDIHAKLGYRRSLLTVIPNGFDVERFRPDDEARTSLRREIGVSDGVPLVGIVGRFDPQKDYETFLDAAARLRRVVPEAQFLLCGAGLEAENPVLHRWVRERDLEAHCRMLGLRRDVPRVQAALDVGVSSSAFGEGFSNAIAEAMSCAVPCAVTNIGDSALIVAETGQVVPPRDPVALADAVARILALSREERQALGIAARDRICSQYSLDRVAAQYQRLYDEL
jgi:glycosyltransferase involved in cell wall biosynthesis